MASDPQDWKSTRQRARTSSGFDLFMSGKTHAAITHSVPCLTANLFKTENANQDVVVKPAVFAQCSSYPTNSDGDVSDENSKLRSQVSQLKSDMLLVSHEKDALQLEKSSLEIFLSAQAKTCAERDAVISSLESGFTGFRRRAKELQQRFDKTELTKSSLELSNRRLKFEIEIIRREKNDMYVDLQRKEKNLRAACEETHHLRTGIGERRENNERLQRECNTRGNSTQIKPKHCIESSETELLSMTDTEESLSCANEQSRTRMSSPTEAIIKVEGKTFRRESILISRDAVIEAQTVKILEMKTRLKKSVAELAEKEAEIEFIRKRACEDAEQRHKLHNMIQELKGNIRVLCRVRPPTDQELHATGDHSLFE